MLSPRCSLPERPLRRSPYGGIGVLEGKDWYVSSFPALLSLLIRRTITITFCSQRQKVCLIQLQCVPFQVPDHVSDLVLSFVH